MKKALKYVVIFLVIAIVIILVARNSNKPNSNKYLEELSNTEKKILVESSYQNWAWGFQYNGTAIFNDGSIYKWKFSGGYQDFEERNTLEEKMNWILENGELQATRVPKKEMDELNQYISKLEDKAEGKEQRAFDAGSNAILVWDYNEDRKITLKEDGDFYVENKTSNSKEIQKIVSKYF